ncbi:hypothetical protein B0H11DRAFT_1929133 [Mycena galericulata]|nr:hypothetical protein B0H11DRAFT_1929133 [Mycena galericulata]
MDFKGFLFNFQLSPTPSSSKHWQLRMDPAPAMRRHKVDIVPGAFLEYHRFRTNLATERAKGRERMRRLRQKNADVALTPSERLRASKTFAAFRERVRTYPLWITTDDDKPEDFVEYQRFVGKVSKGPTVLDDDEVDFLYRHVSPTPRTTFAAFREFVHANIFWLSVDENDPEQIAAYNQFIANNAPKNGPEMSDADLEFLFRHITPEPEILDGDDIVGAGHDTQNSPTPRKINVSNWKFSERKPESVWPSKRRAAIKELPTEMQQEHIERARAARAKYRAQHRSLLMQKEQSRRMKEFEAIPSVIHHTVVHAIWEIECQPRLFFVVPVWFLGHRGDAGRANPALFEPKPDTAIAMTVSTKANPTTLMGAIRFHGCRGYTVDQKILARQWHPTRCAVAIRIRGRSCEIGTYTYGTASTRENVGGRSGEGLASVSGGLRLLPPTTNSLIAHQGGRGLLCWNGGARAGHGGLGAARQAAWYGRRRSPVDAERGGRRRVEDFDFAKSTYGRGCAFYE